MRKKEFLAFFETDLFMPELQATAKEDALKEMVTYLAEKKKVKNERVTLTTILERENLGSTGIGGGVAIPHSRSLMVDQITVLFARSKKGLPYNAVDKAPVNLIFMILAPPQDPGSLYLPFLGKIVEIIKDKKNREKLMAVKDFEEFVDFMRRAYQG
jgi:fructose-specific phosphotransferase system IIA component